MTVSLRGSRSTSPGLSPREISPSLQALTHRAGHSTLPLSVPAREEVSVAPCSFLLIILSYPQVLEPSPPSGAGVGMAAQLSQSMSIIWFDLIV